ncbi:NAD(P)-dependent oxidoreductase [Cellulomonas endophytica]|uniref:NAD(P)-dependent oxidoreductase n=1 Tax=Cellulomonas endophytica TaxID=2494735 RepID=UPI0010109C85|nr:NAD(P)-dependent oxidoreductase [Cellulomonas endophytica]
MKILLPTTLDLDPRLPEGVTAVRYDPAERLRPEDRDAEALVVWGHRGEALAEAARDLGGLRWVQGLAAGDDALLAAGFAPDVVLTTGVGLHTRPVSEHALALVLALVRRLPAAGRAQAEHRWSRELGGPQPLHPDGPVTTLLDARVLVWGFGEIGQALAGYLSALGARVRGVARSAGERAGFDVVDDGALDDELADTDVLVMVLPQAPATERALDAGRIAALPDHAYVVNVGRGSTGDEEALLAALREGRLAGAALDVTATEPLPAGSPLWDEPRVLLTPHAAGGRPVGSDALVAENAAALVAGLPLRNVVAR